MIEILYVYVCVRKPTELNLINHYFLVTIFKKDCGYQPWKFVMTTEPDQQDGCIIS